MTQRVERANEAWAHLKLVYIELLDGIHLACVTFELATAHHVRVQLANSTTCACAFRMHGKIAPSHRQRQLECSSRILRLPVCLLLEIAACKSWSLGNNIGHDICQSAHTSAVGWGHQSTAGRLQRRLHACRKARNKLAQRPWRVDDLDAFSDRWFNVADADASMLLPSVCVCECACACVCLNILTTMCSWPGMLLLSLYCCFVCICQAFQECCLIPCQYGMINLFILFARMSVFRL